MFREFIKGVLILIILAGTFLTPLAWSEEQFSMLYRISVTAATATAIVAFLLIHFKKDKAVDYIRLATGLYLERAGFCFSFQISIEEGQCVLLVFFQNRYDRHCYGRIALRPARGFFLSRADIGTLGIDVECGPGAFGVVKSRIPVAKEHQGTRQQFDVGASVVYPDGRGRQLRFRNAIVLRHNSDFRSPFGKALTLSGAMAASIVVTSPARVALTLPEDVSENVPENALISKTIWKLGDPELSAVELQRLISNVTDSR